MALERDYEAGRHADTRYRALMDTTRDAVVFVNLSNGRMTDVNPPAAMLLGAVRSDLQGAAFAQEFQGRRRAEFLETLSNAAISGEAAPITLQTRRTDRQVRITPSVFRASGEKVLLCRLEAAGDAPQDALSHTLSGLYQHGPDAIVFTDGQGTITAANESFLNLTDNAHGAAARGKPLASYLARGAVDMKVLLDSAARTGRMRVYTTHLETAFGGQVPVEMSATYLRDPAHPAYVFVIRDTSRADPSPTGASMDEATAQSTKDLVGRASLKEIVAETADVIEKMCIETALELTRNNRVAAAEMLNLSRQSLYVKLRKYDLLSRGG